MRTNLGNPIGERNKNNKEEVNKDDAFKMAVGNFGLTLFNTVLPATRYQQKL